MPATPPTTRRRLSRAVPTAVLIAGLAACGSSGEGTEEEERENGLAAAAQRPCADLPTADPSASLPDDVPTSVDQVLYEPSSQGKTTIVFGLVEEDDFVEVRDEIVEGLEDAGYSIEGTDQESVEAEAEFTGPHEGTIKVEPYCEGHVTVRWKLLD